MSVAVILHSSLELFIVFTLASVGIFLWDINSQTNSGVEIEKKFEKLEQRIKELENNSKSDNE